MRVHNIKSYLAGGATIVYVPAGTREEPTYSTPAVSSKEPPLLTFKASNKEDAVAPGANRLPFASTVVICEHKECTCEPCSGSIERTLSTLASMLNEVYLLQLINQHQVSDFLNYARLCGMTNQQPSQRPT
jgi:hypothetical protein